MPEITIPSPSSPLTPPTEITRTNGFGSIIEPKVPGSPTLPVGSVDSRPGVSAGNSQSIYSAHEQDHSANASLVEQVKGIMSDNQLVINTFIAGGLAGATSRTVVSPLERLKIIL
jgi:solute carrier family 25 phosphate transporter 23/24/25/41